MFLTRFYVTSSVGVKPEMRNKNKREKLLALRERQNAETQEWTGHNAQIFTRTFAEIFVDLFRSTKTGTRKELEDAKESQDQDRSEQKNVFENVQRN